MSVLKVYHEVIEDVISAVREVFLEDGVDEQVLQELKQTWESKLMATKAVNQSETEKQGAKKVGELSNTINFSKLPLQGVKQVVGQVAPNNHVQTQSVAQVVEPKTVPVQITLPSQPGTNLPQRVLTIHVPAGALQDNQLHKILTAQIIAATMHLPPAIATYVLQNHVNSTYAQLGNSNHLGAMLSAPTGTPKTVIQNDGANDEDEALLEPNAPSCSNAGTNNIRFKENDEKLLRQLDGHDDTSDDDEDGSEDDEPSDDNDEDKDEDDNLMEEEEGPEEEPLNSEDDVTDEDPTDLFDTDNVVVCQYDKITRSRNKWKFHLKDGIMNLNGEDYVFQKANGDAEW